MDTKAVIVINLDVINFKNSKDTVELKTHLKKLQKSQYSIVLITNKTIQDLVERFTDLSFINYIIFNNHTIYDILNNSEIESANSNSFEHNAIKKLADITQSKKVLYFDDSSDYKDFANELDASLYDLSVKPTPRKQYRPRSLDYEAKMLKSAFRYHRPRLGLDEPLVKQRGKENGLRLELARITHARKRGCTAKKSHIYRI